MSMDLFAFQLAVIFLPGLLWARLDARFGSRLPCTEFELVVRAFLFGVASYALTFIVYAGLGRPFELSGLTSATALSPEMADEIFSSITLAMVACLIWIYIQTYNLGPRFLQLIRATKQEGYSDLWDFLFDLSITAVEYVHVRDHQVKLTYAGWVELFSEGGRSSPNGSA